ncbi:hypothetical protein H6P81_006168 [Aristolochia fimbriata]|uniref:Uncharacterized protein n=1 Tax=Aristolochia fimbriata TaxID=158543 RepID=A0AAV7EXY1_ARIFI|nr:hypothetical protein H6P81_006168 [Aristolochia fimbriata]
MGTVFGKIGVETPKFELLQTSPDYEIRKYSPSIVAEVTYDPAELRGNRDGGFTILANYIGALGNPQNRKPEKIAMTAPVITRTGGVKAGEKIAMTGPVITKISDAVTMQFVLPSKYGNVEEVPVPVDERVAIKREGERKYGVVRFNGVATESVVEEKVERLKQSLERDGFKVIGDFLLASAIFVNKIILGECDEGLQAMDSSIRNVSRNSYIFLLRNHLLIIFQLILLEFHIFFDSSVFLDSGEKSKLKGDWAQLTWKSLRLLSMSCILFYTNLRNITLSMLRRAVLTLAASGCCESPSGLYIFGHLKPENSPQYDILEQQGNEKSVTYLPPDQ